MKLSIYILHKICSMQKIFIFFFRNLLVKILNLKMYSSLIFFPGSSISLKLTYISEMHEDIWVYFFMYETSLNVTKINIKTTIKFSFIKSLMQNNKKVHFSQEKYIYFVNACRSNLVNTVCLLQFWVFLTLANLFFIFKNLSNTFLM